MICLHKDKEVFQDLILETSAHFKILPEIIRHDYYVSFILKEIAKRMPQIIFKGGTSLSKCYRVIDRYSEDIDLNCLQEETLTNKKLKDFHHEIFNIVESLGFEIIDKDKLRSGGKSNYIFAVIDEGELSSRVKIETYLILKSFPINKQKVHSYIEDYLIKIDKQDLIEKYGLNSFFINVQNIERTFIDKIFAICDYYERKEEHRNSRHLYDLHKLYHKINFNENFIKLFKQVKNERQLGNPEIYISSQDDYNLKQILQKIIDTDFYKSDYEHITKMLMFDKVEYEDAKQTLQLIINKL